MLGKRLNLSFLWTIGTRRHGVRQAHRALRFASHPVYTSTTVATNLQAHRLPATLHTAPGTRRRRSLYQAVCSFSLRESSTSAQPTTEAELVAISFCVKQGIYLCGTLRELEWRIFHSDRIFCDNKETLLVARWVNYCSRSKRLATRFLGLRVWIIDKMLVIDRVSTKSQLSNIFTKFLVRLIFTELSSALNRAYKRSSQQQLGITQLRVLTSAGSGIYLFVHREGLSKQFTSSTYGILLWRTAVSFSGKQAG